MGRMKDLLITIYGGGDEAVEAAKQIAGLSEIVPHDYEPRWIPVAEYMPELGARVMIANANDKWVSIGERAITGAYYHWRGDHGEELYDPTHWRLLPELPEVE